MHPNKPVFQSPSHKNVFVMMRYRKGELFEHIERIISSTLEAKGLYAFFAKDASKEELLWPNVRTYMDNCDYGFAVFDGLPIKTNESRLNPNVCLELGYMLSRGKRCLMVRDVTIEPFTDIMGFIIPSFDCQNLKSTLPPVISKWIRESVIALPLLQAFSQLLPGSKVAKRIDQYALEKLAIGKYLATEYFPMHRPKTIVLDSGTTAAAVAEALSLNSSKKRKIVIHTNNLLASLLLSSAKHFKCQVVPGQVEENFAGVFGEAAINAIQKVRADMAILACTGFTAERGPFANSSENLEFKRAILERNTHTIIVVPADRLGVKPRKGKPVILNPSEWRKLLDTNVARIVTCPEVSTPAFLKQRKLLGGKLRIVQL